MKLHTVILSMLATLALAVLLTFTAGAARSVEQSHSATSDTAQNCTEANTIDTDNREMDIMRMAYATAWVESRWNETAVNGTCVGFLQISPIMVREANRLLGFECFTLDDRWDEQGSLAIYHVVMDYHNPGADIVRACRIWNGPQVSDRYIEQVIAKYNALTMEGWYYDMD